MPTVATAPVDATTFLAVGSASTSASEFVDVVSVDVQANERACRVEGLLISGDGDAEAFDGLGRVNSDTGELEFSSSSPELLRLVPGANNRVQLSALGGGSPQIWLGSLRFEFCAL